MTQVNRDDLLVAQRPGTRLFLAGGPRLDVTFEGPSEKTLFFRKDTAEQELRRIRIPLESVLLRPAKLSYQLT